MDPTHDYPADPQPNWAQLLPREAFHEIILTLRGALPRPESGDPLDARRRDRAAMAAVGSLLPANAAEGRLAAQFVVADAWALDCLRLAGERRLEFNVARQCRAQAMSLMRESRSALRLLLRLQAVRQKIAADDAAANRAEWVEHAALGMMEAALSGASGAAAPEAGVPAGPVVDEGAVADAVSADATLSHAEMRETKPERVSPRPQAGARHDDDGAMRGRGRPRAGGPLGGNRAPMPLARLDPARP